VKYVRLLGIAVCLIVMGVKASQGTSVPESLVDLDIKPPSPRPVAPRWGRDPFSLGKLETKNEDGGGTLSLSAIIFREGKGVAIVNDQIVRKGDSIGGKVVGDILSDRVILRERGRIIELRVNPFTIN
jgi:hypothetical protein